ncbi:MAG TPA: ATP-binding protein [Fibrobacteraceae bacterium]|nr:ATP-binding protein [Fibrobacteraceae bacterium]
MELAAIGALFPFPVISRDAHGGLTAENTAAQQWLDAFPDCGAALIPPCITPTISSSLSFAWLWRSGSHTGPLDQTWFFASPYPMGPVSRQSLYALLDRELRLVYASQDWLDFFSLHVGVRLQPCQAIPPFLSQNFGTKIIMDLRQSLSVSVSGVHLWPTGADDEAVESQLTPLLGVEGDLLGVLWEIMPEIQSTELDPMPLRERVMLDYPDPAGLLDREGSLLMANHTLATCLQTQVSALRGKRLLDWVVEEDARQLLSSALRKALQGEQTHCEVELPLVNRRAWFSVTFHPFHGDDGQVMGAILGARDISVQRETEMNLNKARSNFISCISHELRTPLTAVLNLAEVLSMSPLTEEQGEIVAMVKEAGDVMSRQVNAVLDYSRLERGKITLNPEHLYFEALIHRILNLFQQEAQKRELELHCHLDKEIPQLLVGDPTALEQVLSNLLGNALKFTQTGGVTLSVKLVSRNKKEAQLHFAVADTGRGIDPTVGSQIFAMFFQGDSSWKRHHNGMGLGLAIAEKLTSLMHGVIWYEDNKPHGAIFNIHLTLGIPA